MKAGFVVPVYRHGSAVEGVVRAIVPLGLPVILVDDGNDEANKRQIENAAKVSTLVTVVTRRRNGGKGAAVKSGVLKASEMGLTHVFQVDSDGQHDTGAVPHFLDEAAKHPDCIICGYPQYDETVPAGRKSGREISNRYARFLSVTGEVKDVMCGFRVYPVEPYIRLIRRRAIVDSRMGYDADILVHLVWMGLHVLNYPVKVTYPADGISNFRMVRDNIRISAAFTRLSFELLWRFPLLFCKKCLKECGKNANRVRIKQCEIAS